MFCLHRKWTIIGKNETIVEDDMGSKYNRTYYHLQCEKCGKVKHRKVRGHAT